MVTARAGRAARTRRCRLSAGDWKRAPGATLGALVFCVLCACGMCLGGCSAIGSGRPAEPLAASGMPATARPEGPPGAGRPPDGAWDALTDQPIRVGLAASVESVVVSARGAFSLTVYSGAARRLQASSGEEWTFVGTDAGITARSSGGQSLELAQGTVRLRPEAPAAMVVNGVAYRGEIEVYPAAPGSLTVVNVVGMEAYLRGVVPGEIGARSPAEIEAVKAQAVAARTYAAASSGGRAAGDFDVLATIADQLYQGADFEDPVCDRAILETAGLILTFAGRPAHTYFHSTCGGRTAARHEVWELGELPYLRSLPDGGGRASRPDDAWCRSSPSFTWTVSWTGDEVARLVRGQLPAVASTPVREPIGDIVGLAATERSPSGRVRWLEVRTTSGTYRVFGDRVRRLLLRPDTGGILRSAWFDLDVKTSGGRVVRVTARGRGNGHGVGMCQHGALGQARAGRSCEEILAHYYPGTALARLRDVW